MTRLRLVARPVRRAAIIVLVTCAAAPARAHNPEAPENSVRAPELTFLDHSGTGPFWFSAQANSILQSHPDFPAKYTGTNSLRPEAEAAISGLLTVYAAFVYKTAELIVDPEMALGGGLSNALGVAGFPNLDVVRNPTLSHAPYLGRVEWHQIIPLSRDWVPNDDRGPISSFATVPRHRLELRVGKMSTVDVFDINPAASDSHLQFMNWTVDNNGAFDYAADTRGYTIGAIVEYQGPFIEVRLGEMLMPKVANGLDLDWDVGTNRGENLELEIKYSRRQAWAGTVRLLAFQNHAKMGSYREAVDAAAAAGATPDITAHRAPGRSKRGVGFNVIQELAGRARAFARLGWNDGHNESFAYTEVDDTVEVGGDLLGTAWHRATDRLGLAFVTNGISGPHRDYLRAGGLGFLLGDGALSYGREIITEQYYNVHAWRGLYFAEDVQWIVNPAYNTDRGPVWVLSARAHLEL